MRIAAPSRSDTTHLDAQAGAVRLWLAELWLALIDILDRCGAAALAQHIRETPILTEAVAALEGGVRSYVFVKALDRYTRPRHQRQIHHAHTRLRRRDFIRACLGHHFKAPKHADLLQRIARLIALFDDLEPHIAKVATRIARIRLRLTRLAYTRHVAPIALRSAMLATVCTADTS